jgi:hypothetical protein
MKFMHITTPLCKVIVQVWVVQLFLPLYDLDSKRGGNPMENFLFCSKGIGLVRQQSKILIEAIQGPLPATDAFKIQSIDA